MTTTKHASLVAAALSLFLFALDRPAQSADQGENLVGKYYSECYYGAKDSIDTLEFLPNGKYVVDLGDGSGGIVGSSRGISDGKLTVEYGNPQIVRSYKAARLRNILTLTDSRERDFSFVLRPDPPHPKAEDLMGTYSGKRDYGDKVMTYVYKRTPDHQAETLMRILYKTEHTYRDFHLSFQWTYDDGITTYKLEKTDLPAEFRYVHSRDFISKRDEKGIWLINTVMGDYLVCEVPVDTFALPLPPAGFHSDQ